MFTIEFILPYKKLRTVVEQAFEEHPHRHEMDYVISYVGAPELKTHALVGDVLIARGLTAVFLNQLLDGSSLVLELPMTGYDILRAVYEGTRVFGARHIAVILTENALYGFNNFKKHLDLDIRTYEITDEQDSEALIAAAVAGGADLIVGGDQMVTLAGTMGYPGIRVEAEKESVRQVIDEAWHLFQSNQQERMRGQRMRALIENINEGVILCDSEKHAIFCNQLSQELLGLDRNEILDRPVGQIDPVFDDPDFCLLEKSVPDRLVAIHKTQMVLSRIPVKVGDDFVNGIIVLRKRSQIQRTEIEIRRQIHKKGHRATYQFNDIIGQSRSIMFARKLGTTYARVDASVLLVGETGTGKEMFAQSIHNSSNRRNGPFVAVNCAALPDSLLESELFGYVDGAFTGASKNGKMGLFELAHGGTIFLDEISEMCMSLQGRLLRVIEEREIMRIGDDKVIPIDIRIIAATNRNLEAMILENKFRNDLFYRLNVLPLAIPSLAQRQSDIPLLTQQFVAQFDAKNKVAHHILGQVVLEYLQRLPWPGNIRQLRNFCERLSVVIDSSVVSIEEVHTCLGMWEQPSEEQDDIQNPQFILATLERCNGNKKLAALELGVNRTTLYRWLKKFECCI